MHKKLIPLALGICLAASAAVAQTKSSAPHENPNQQTVKNAATAPNKDIAAIKQLEADYVRSINAMDYQLADRIWINSAQVSYIHPRGHSTSWQKIKDEFYKGTMDDFFSKRNLRITTEPTIAFYGKNRDVAVVEFYWVFDAVMRKDGEPLRTEGRESQVLVKGADDKWRIAQIHYSGPPVTGDRQGF